MTSGVVGKGIVEKLLRSCNVKRIYMLIREKKGMSAEDRLKQVKENKVGNILFYESNSITLSKHKIYFHRSSMS